MKRILIILTFVLISLNTLALDMWVKGGIVNGVGGKKTEESGYNIGLELSQGFLGIVDFGAGIAYNGNLNYENNSVQKNIGYDLAPVYVFAKYNIIPIAIKPYLVGRLGKVFVVNDNTNYNGKLEAEGDVYGSIGVGVNFLNSLQGEILYSISKVENNPSGKDNVEMVSLTLGYNFW